MSQVQVVYNNDGAIPALIGPPPQGHLNAGIAPAPNQNVRAMDVPANLANEKLSMMHNKLRVDLSSGTPRLVTAQLLCRLPRCRRSDIEMMDRRCAAPTPTGGA